MTNLDKLNNYCKHEKTTLKWEFDYSREVGKIEVIRKHLDREDVFEKKGLCLETMAKLILSEIETLEIPEGKKTKGFILFSAILD